MSERRFYCDEETFRLSCKNICHEMFDFPILFEVFGEYVFFYLLGYRYVFAVQLWSKRIAEQKWIWGLYHCLPAPTSCSSTVNFHRFRLQVGLVFVYFQTNVSHVSGWSENEQRLYLRAKGRGRGKEGGWSFVYSISPYTLVWLLWLGF